MPDGSEKPIGYAFRTVNKANVATPSWRKKVSQLYLGSSIFTPICMDIHLTW